MTRYDETLNKVLFMMEVSTRLDTRIAWLRQLEHFTDQMGLSTMHWVERINGILEDYVGGTVDMDLTVSVLKVL